MNSDDSFTFDYRVSGATTTLVNTPGVFTTGQKYLIEIWMSGDNVRITIDKAVIFDGTVSVWTLKDQNRINHSHTAVDSRVQNYDAILREE